MPSTRREKAKARKYRETDLMSDFDNMDVMIGNENINPTERELANTIEGSANHYDAESNSHTMRNSSQENEIIEFDHKNTVPKQDRFSESMETFTNEINLRLSQICDSMMHSHNSRAISSAIERVIRIRVPLR